MSAVVLDAGAFVAVEANDRSVVAWLRAAHRRGLGLRTTGAVVAQVWREPTGRQANLARLLKSVDVVPVDQRTGRQGGVLMGHSGTHDAVDATLVAIAADGDRIVTGDPGDIRALVAVSGRQIAVRTC